MQRILVIEDENDIRQLLRFNLEREGSVASPSSTCWDEEPSQTSEGRTCVRSNKCVFRKKIDLVLLVKQVNRWEVLITTRM